MIRTALRPRWLGFLALALTALYVCWLLGSWQLGVARSDAATEALEQARSRPSAPLSQVLAPHQRWDGRVLSNRQVTMTGRYDPAGQFLVPERYLDGARGYWVVTAFRMSQPAGVVATVRGWTAQPVAPAPPSGERTVSATLAQGESPSAASLPAGQEGSIDLSRLVNRWPGDLYNAIAFAQSAPDPGLTRVPPPQPESGLSWRNAMYAVQWWLFGLFCPLLWFRMVLAAHREQHVTALRNPDPTPDRGEPDAPR